jgi:glycoside/pentoside/hexuronide:cation symporter, GPH family
MSLPSTVVTEPAAGSPIPAPAKPSDEAGTRELFAYSSSDVGRFFIDNLTNGLLTPILVSILLVDPKILGLILMVRGLLDSVTDPLMGYFSDNFRSRWGRRRPFILLGSVLMAPLMVAMWSFPRGSDPTHIAVWVAIALFFFALAQTIFSVPYNALGMELSLSYHGRTRVQLFRTMVSRISNFASPFLLPFCLLGIFSDALQGVRWLAGAGAVVLLATGWTAFRGTHERVRVDMKRENFFHALRSTLKSWDFLKITFIYVSLLFCLGAFGSFQYFLTIYYVFSGDVARGAQFSAYVETLANVLVLLGIPLIGWAAKKFQKHNALRGALLLMVIGSALQIVLLDPERPWLMFITPFFYSLGIVSTFVILGALLANVIDADELASGRRREGLFGAAASMIMKSVGAFAAGASGFLIAWTGFDAAKGGAQDPGVFDHMLWMFAAKGIVLLGCFFVLHRYPLTEQRIAEIQALIRQRKEAEAKPSA